MPGRASPTPHEPSARPTRVALSVETMTSARDQQVSRTTVGRVDVSEDRWFFAGRHYMVTLASSADDMSLELADVGPGVGRGFVAMANKLDDSEEITLRMYTADSLPIELLDQFIGEARTRLPSSLG